MLPEKSTTENKNTEIILVGEVSQEQIDKWKLKHGDVFRAIVGKESVCYLKTPDRLTVKASMSAGKDKIRSNEILLENCWLGGDETIKTDNAKFFGISGVLDELIEIKSANLKKL